MKKAWLFGASLAAVVFTGAASAADLGTRMPVKAPVAAPAYNWTGFYIGGNAGYGWGDPSSFLTWNKFASDPAPLTPADYDTHVSGAVAGAQIGYNYQINSFLVGAETDFQYSGIKGSTTTPSTYLPAMNDFARFREDQRIAWFGTLRGRLGVLATPTVLVYATGVLAYGSVEANSHFNYDTPPFAHYDGSTKQTKAGWTAGGGAEWALGNRWSVKAEYLYYDLGSISVTGSEPGNLTFFTLLDQKVNGQIVRVGANFRLN